MKSALRDAGYANVVELSARSIQTQAVHQQKKDLRRAGANRFRTGCIYPMHLVRPDCPPDYVSPPMRPTKVRTLWLRPEASGAT